MSVTGRTEAARGRRPPMNTSTYERGERSCSCRQGTETHERRHFCSMISNRDSDGELVGHVAGCAGEHVGWTSAAGSCTHLWRQGRMAEWEGLPMGRGSGRAGAAAAAAEAEREDDLPLSRRSARATRAWRRSALGQSRHGDLTFPRAPNLHLDFPRTRRPGPGIPIPSMACGCHVLRRARAGGDRQRTRAGPLLPPRPPRRPPRPRRRDTDPRRRWNHL